MKKLYKSNTNKIFCGVIGGVGEYFDVDPVILRLLWLVILIATGVLPGLIVYIVACLIVPEKPNNITNR
jgi:phage shock protein C